MEEFKNMIILYGCGILIGLLIIVACVIPEAYTTEYYTVEAGDTFWGIYLDRYSDHISYQEALYNFKKDNNMEKYELIERTTSNFKNL